MSLVLDARRAIILKKLSCINLAACLAPLPLSFDTEEVRQHTIFFDKLVQHVDGIIAELPSLNAAYHSADNATNHAEFLRIIQNMCGTALAVNSIIKRFVKQVMLNGHANARRLKYDQLQTAPLTNLVLPEDLSLHEMQGHTAIWDRFLQERLFRNGGAEQSNMQPTDSKSADQPSPQQTNSVMAPLPSTQQTISITTTQVLPPGAVKLLRAWEREIEETAGRINQTRTAQSVAADPLYAPLFDTSSLEERSFTDEHGIEFTIRGAVAREDMLPSLDDNGMEVDDHSLEGYNQRLGSWLRDEQPHVHGGMKEVWLVKKKFSISSQGGARTAQRNGTS